MPDANALTYQDIQNGVLGRRFNAASQLPSVKRWIATAYADVWNALRGDGRMWTFEIVFRSPLSIVGGDSTPVMPADYGDTLSLYDQAGCELRRLSYEEFERELALSAATTAAPYAYTVVGRQITLGPTPAASATYTHTYRRRLACRDTLLAVKAGMMSLPTDYPLWDDHHAILIARAQALGLQEINDPTWQGPQAEFERQLARMREDYEQTVPGSQWARACWY